MMMKKGREVMTGKHPEITWKDTTEEQRKEKPEREKDEQRASRIDARVQRWRRSWSDPGRSVLIEIRWEAGRLEERWRNWRKQATL